VRNGELLACCEQERVTRVRRWRLEPGALTTEAIGAVMSAAGVHDLGDTAVYAAEKDRLPRADLKLQHVEHQKAHAASAFCSSPFERAALLVCDRQSKLPTTSWVAGQGELAPCLEIDAPFAALRQSDACLVKGQIAHRRNDAQ
jgi:predicted NodU family carbamoyl transferase